MMKRLTEKHKAKISNTLRGKPRPQCHNQTSFQKGHITSQEVRGKISAANKGRKHSLDERHKRSVSLIGHLVSEKTRGKLSRIFKGRVFTVEHKHKMSEAQKGQPGHHTHPHSQETKEKLSNIGKELWNNPTYRKAQVKAIMKGLRKRPTSPEQQLINLIKASSLPFEYTGSGRLIIDGKVPDFANVNGKKQVIEVFGLHWHNVFDISKLANHYAKQGYSLLVIWEDELKVLPEADIVKRIRKFSLMKEAKK